MSITDELREWAEDNTLRDRELTTYPPQHVVHGVLETLLCIADRIDAKHKEAEQDLIDANNQMEQLCECSIRLPVDADGVPIRVGDVMDKGEVTCIRDCGKGWEVVLNNLYTYDTPSLHHRAPTVEDVLREFAYGLGVPVADSTVAAAAAKLRLAGDAE